MAEKEHADAYWERCASPVQMVLQTLLQTPETPFWAHRTPLGSAADLLLHYPAGISWTGLLQSSIDCIVM